MSWTTSFRTAAAVASVSVVASISPVLAQEEAVEEKPADAAAELGVSVPKPAKAFYPLVRCVRVEGRVQIQKPRDEKAYDAEEGRYYPLGSVVRTAAGASIELEFGEKAKVTVEQNTEFATREIEIGEQTRAAVLRGGRVHFDLPQLADGLFKVVTANLECKNLAGESVFEYAKLADGDELLVRCVTRSLSVTGKHYDVPRMGAANQIRIRTTGDALFTSIRGESGDCHVMLDQGLVREKNFDPSIDAVTKEVEKKLEFVLSPKCAVKIFRAKSSVSGRVSVTTMTFNAADEMVNRFAFAEGLSNINSGELVVDKRVVAESKAKDKDGDDDDEAEEAKPAAQEGDDDEKKEEKKDDEDSGN